MTLKSLDSLVTREKSRLTQEATVQSFYETTSADPFTGAENGLPLMSIWAQSLIGTKATGIAMKMDNVIAKDAYLKLDDEQKALFAKALGDFTVNVDKAINKFNKLAEKTIDKQVTFNPKFDKDKALGEVRRCLKMVMARLSSVGR